VSVAVTLRAATDADCEAVWRWNGAPDVRARSRHPEPIPLDHHRAWYTARLADPACRLSIVEVAGAAAGVIRIEPADGDAVVSIALAAEQRGRGIGRAAIAAACAAYRADHPAARLVAWIDADNPASARAFAAAGFARAGADAADPRWARWELAC